VEVFHHAGVGVAAECRGGVPEQFLHDLDVHAGLQADSGGDVPQVVEPDRRQPRAGASGGGNAGRRTAARRPQHLPRPKACQPSTQDITTGREECPLGYRPSPTRNLESVTCKRRSHGGLNPGRVDMAIPSGYGCEAMRVIPNLATFVYIGDMPFSYVHALAVRSAAVVNRFDRMRLICDRIPTGKWWDECRDLLEVQITTPPDNVFGVPLRHPSHVTDVIRFHEMLSTGGVFLDLDVLCVKLLNRYRGSACVLGRQERDGQEYGLGCAVMCEPHARFIDQWFSGYDPARSLWHGFRSTGRDAYWSEMSTRYASMLAQRMPDDLTVLDHTVFYPYNWEPAGLRTLFEEDVDLPGDTCCLHLWEANAWPPYLSKIGPAEVERGGTTFTRAAKAVLAGLLSRA
jgi:hypothetical protein